MAWRDTFLPLLDMFPRAKFVHIHRNPYAVFPSSKWTFQVNRELHRLQRTRPDDLDDWVLRQYRQMYEVFFEERRLVPEGNFVEVWFAQLEGDHLRQMAGLYGN